VGCNAKPLKEGGRERVGSHRCLWNTKKTFRISSSRVGRGRGGKTHNGNSGDPIKNADRTEGRERSKDPVKQGDAPIGRKRPTIGGREGF